MKASQGNIILDLLMPLACIVFVFGIVWSIPYMMRKEAAVNAKIVGAYLPKHQCVHTGYAGEDGDEKVYKCDVGVMRERDIIALNKGK